MLYVISFYFIRIVCNFRSLKSGLNISVSTIHIYVMKMKRKRKMAYNKCHFRCLTNSKNTENSMSMISLLVERCSNEIKERNKK